MKSILTFLLIGLIVGITSCKSSSDAGISNDSEASITDSTDVVNLSDDDDQMPKSLFASIERGACYGSCPTYKMYIYSDGSVDLIGTRAVDYIGTYTGHVTSEQMTALIDTATSIGFMDLEDRYDGQVTDLPGAKTSIVIDGVSKEVYRRFNYPKRILHFERLFDAILNGNEWTKVEIEK